jgi:predicted RNA-binding Zn ribbon-like protein
MLAVWLRLRTELRAHWGGTLALVVVLGVAGAVVLGAVAGARRTSTAPERLVEAVGGEGDAHIFDAGAADPGRIRTLPQVEHSVAIDFLLADTVPLTGLEIVVIDDPLFHGLLVEGELPDPADPQGAVVDQKVARGLGLGVGDEIDVVLVTGEQLAALDPATEPVPSTTVRIAGVVREPDDIVGGGPAAVAGGESDATVYMQEAFLDRYGHLTEVVNTVYQFDLAGGAGATDEFVAAVRDLPDGDTVEFFRRPGLGRATQRGVDAQALALALSAGALALMGLVVGGQSLARQLRVDAADGGALRALGMTDGQRVAVAAMRGLLVGGGAAVVAVAGAIALSPATPIGLARQAEPGPGVDVNVAVLVVGGIAIVALVAGLAALTGLAITRREAPRQSGSVATALAGRAGRAGAPGSLVTGLSLAGGWRGSGVSTASTIAGMGTGVVAVAAAATFLASFDAVLDDPERFGWTVDAVAGSVYNDDPGDLFEVLAAEPGVAAFAPAVGVPISADGLSIGVLGVEPAPGIAPSPILDGRAPTAAREVALGRRTLEQLGRQVGDTVRIDGGGGPVDVTITGTAVVPEVNQGGPGLGEGGVMTLAGVRALVPTQQPNIALVRFAPGGEDSPAIDQLRFAGELVPPVVPDALYDLERVRALPTVLSALLAALGVATLVHSLVSLVRGHRRDLAVLKVLGFTRSQVAATAAWQGTAFAIVALAVGLPLGLAVGRWLWRAIADQLGIVAAPRLPILAVVVMVPAALVVANVAAAVPGWLAARVRPADVLRSE